MPVRTRAEITADIERIAVKAVGRIRTAYKSIIDPAYASGDPKTKRPGEASAANVTKKIIATYAIKALAASDTILELPVGDETVVDGAIVGAADSGLFTGAKLQLLFDYYFPVKPGSTTTLDTSVTEQSTTSTSFVDVPTGRAEIGRPGRYRVSAKLSRAVGGTTSAQVQIERRDGTRIDASNVITYSGTVHPTYSADLNMDMSVTVEMNGILVVQLKHSIGGAQTAYIKDIAIKLDDATASQAIRHAFL